MTKYRKQSIIDNKKSQEEGKIPEEAEMRGSESCRCKEVAKKTPREMLRLMISDMAFWKKAKGQK